MTRNWYLLLLRMLHFVDNALALPREHPDCDRLFKIRPVLDHFVDRFSEVYVPGKEISVDESLVLFKGRSVFKQYIPSKRAGYEIKSYLLSENSTGYVYNFRVYTSRDSSIDPPGCPATFGVSEQIVWELARRLFNKGHHLYVDHFYTGVQLFKELFRVDTVACGTIRSNRKGYPRELVCKKLERGQCSALRNNELLALKFVAVWGQVAEVRKPACILDYNRHMGGVDRVDQRLEPYTALLVSLLFINKKSDGGVRGVALGWRCAWGGAWLAVCVGWCLEGGVLGVALGWRCAWGGAWLAVCWGWRLAGGVLGVALGWRCAWGGAWKAVCLGWRLAGGVRGVVLGWQCAWGGAWLAVCLGWRLAGGVRGVALGRRCAWGGAWLAVCLGWRLAGGVLGVALGWRCGWGGPWLAVPAKQQSTLPSAGVILVSGMWAYVSDGHLSGAVCRCECCNVLGPWLAV
ncbi:hypothetical protein NDU88_005507 [Pleurodeles waltl]|uniref:PiggyBac transposable element-derived protein domain-containing protein n=1 Tax=Pleurodeles waltl TaxID=8319 RepID=A0AAV7TVN0_PLEWA|nr:hypothetical protein NDU88_005507 [Pleurodeles waltl]